MPTEQELRDKMLSLKDEYSAAVPTQPAHVCYELSQKHIAARRELEDFLSTGANPCACGAMPTGRRRTPETPVKNCPGEFNPAIYAIQCMACGKIAQSSQGPEKAVENWNAGKFIKG